MVIPWFYLQQGGDGECGDAAVDVCDQVLQVEITGGDGCRVLHSHLQREGGHITLHVSPCCVVDIVYYNQLLAV